MPFGWMRKDAGQGAAVARAAVVREMSIVSIVGIVSIRVKRQIQATISV